MLNYVNNNVKNIKAKNDKKFKKKLKNVKYKLVVLTLWTINV